MFSIGKKQKAKARNKSDKKQETKAIKSKKQKPKARSKGKKQKPRKQEPGLNL